MRIVVAPDSFKGTVDASRAADAMARGWASVRPDDEVSSAPLADGGEGTLDVIARSVPGATYHDVPGCTGPDGRTVTGRWLALPDGTAVVDLAQVVGLPRMERPDALGASTRGLGEVIGSALDAGALSLVIALGGSASTDGGAGALSALGLALLDEAGEALPDGGGALERLFFADMTDLRRPPAGGVTLLTDVTNPLLGSTGSAAVYGPQKGAGPDDVARLENGLSRFAGVLGGAPDAPGAGAAGGTAYGFTVAWKARVEPGAAAIARLVGLENLLAGADVLLTGEGRFDATSLHGKAVGEALALAAHGPRTAVVAGTVAARSALDALGTWHCALSEIAGSDAAAVAEPERWLFDAGARAARELGGPTSAA
ncbi:glycerate kinase [Sanguibacter suaedae]|uniref:Glycerate kinase n=1 Tax=Sanguibacter suaedae TaxID=2795737 RepID=A0A934I290_9MICO|nr:glycerate kinase [Sanguibacter suaedae]MBI9113868.1 glycerate kinase [Sanguibacter suaedae]